MKGRRSRVFQGAVWLGCLAALRITAQEQEPSTAPPTTGGTPSLPPNALLIFGAAQTAPHEVIEGRTEFLYWEQVPETAEKVVAYLRTNRTSKGSRRRGSEVIPLGKPRPAEGGRLSFQVPWLDSLEGVLVVKALNGQSATVAKEVIPLKFRPAKLENRRQDGLYVDLSHRRRQRLYLQRGGELVLVFLCSGGSGRRDKHGVGHDHRGWFRITQKTRYHVSSFDRRWTMPYALRYHQGHFIHGTSPNQYRRLGHPASHGCIRLHRGDARKLYNLVRVGEHVLIY